MQNGRNLGTRALFATAVAAFLATAGARAQTPIPTLPPLPPLAERWALTAEESMRTSAAGPPACASAWNSFTQTPLAAQRT